MWNKRLIVITLLVFILVESTTSLAIAACNDAWVTSAVKEVTGREPNGSGNSGDCNIYNYGNGSWNSYDDLKNKVRTYFSQRAVLNQTATQSTSGQCNDAWVTSAVKEVTGHAPNGSGNSGDCNIYNYGNGSWNSYDDLKNKVKTYFAVQNPTPVQQTTFKPGQCSDPWINQAIKELIGRDPKGSGKIGECNPYNYGNGSWGDYNDFKNKVKASIFNNDPAAKSVQCFGGEGSGCEALEKLGNVGVYKVGRTNLSNGHYLMWISPGSIKHDTCCLVYPNGKMCGGSVDATPDMKSAASNPLANGDGHCVAEWDKAFWNANDGRAWTEEFDPNAVPDLTIIDNPRQTKTQSGIKLIGIETVETRKYSAPAGQNLDVGDEAFCKSGRAQLYYLPGTSKQWIQCL